MMQFASGPARTARRRSPSPAPAATRTLSAARTGRPSPANCSARGAPVASEISTRSLRGMQEEVVAWCHRKGWYDKPLSFGEAMTGLHSEVSEAGEAWRRWGGGDATDPAVE